MIKYYYGDRCAGKSAMLIEMASGDDNPRIIQPRVHWISDGKVWSRNGKELPCISFSDEASLKPLIEGFSKVYVDEVEMLTLRQLDELRESPTECICFGLYYRPVAERAYMTVCLD